MNSIFINLETKKKTNLSRAKEFFTQITLKEIRNTLYL